MFEDNFYAEVDPPAIEAADKIRIALAEEDFEMLYPAPTNQVFFLADEATIAKLDETVDYGFIETWSDGRQLERFATSWSTTSEAANQLVSLIHSLKKRGKGVMTEVIKHKLDGRTVKTFPAEDAQRSVVFSSEFDSDGSEILQGWAALDCPFFHLVTISGINWNEDLSPWETNRVLGKSRSFYGRHARIPRLVA
ncbi:hypothetical protein ACUYFE_08285 [Olegusella massiliensis]|uniref:hypothetical protein n=1 Tax=Olegusella massiliensis TaxID=1776381 RepID=UPI0040556207